jgi:hypothetical protein
MLSLKGSTCGLKVFVTVFCWIYLTTDFVCLLGGPVCSGKLCTRWVSGGHFTGVANSGHWQPSKPLLLQQWHDPHHCSEHHNMAHVTSHNDTILVTCACMRCSFHLSQNQGQDGWCSDAPNSLCLLPWNPESISGSWEMNKVLFLNLACWQAGYTFRY